MYGSLINFIELTGNVKIAVCEDNNIVSTSNINCTRIFQLLVKKKISHGINM